MQDFSQPQTNSGTSNNTTGTNEPVDGSLAHQMHGLVSEAAERVTFYRCETERWQRIGQAAASAIHHLQSAAPIPQTTADEFLKSTMAPDQPAAAQGSW